MANTENRENEIQILVATHKEYKIPETNIYLPIHVGKYNKSDIGYIGDDTGDNISSKNKHYCELTALYWAWKNINCDYIGLNHYRRYFLNKENKKRENSLYGNILNEEYIRYCLKEYDIILPKKRNYLIESVESHYAHAHNIDDLLVAKEIIRELYPEYLDSFNSIMKGKKMHLYNMFVMPKSLFDEYAEWLFNILFKLETKVNLENYSEYQARVYGFISERLFNVWIHYKELNIKELDIFYTEKENKTMKYINFLRRKVMAK